MEKKRRLGQKVEDKKTLNRKKRRPEITSMEKCRQLENVETLRRRQKKTSTGTIVECKKRRKTSNVPTYILVNLNFFLHF
jgi:hypothetical protein